MPPLELLALALFFCALGLLVIAALSDIATMQIPNWVSIVTALAFPLAALATGQEWTTIALHIGCGVTIFAIGALLFNLNVLGGGDVKVFAAASIWTGFSALTPFLAITFIAGGGLAVIMLVMRRFLTPSPALPGFLNRLVDKSRGVPYAVAIAIGALASVREWPIFTTLQL